MAEKGGRGTLTLRTSLTSDDASESVLVEIGDTGVGIPERDLQKIFNPFFTTKPVGQGTGLGLSICFGIVKEHDGQIWAESQLGVGTRVYVSLPVRTLNSAAAMPSAMDAQPDETAQPLHVLVVDDEEPVVRLMARLLHDIGHQATLVTSGEAALDAIGRETFDLILCDVKMPGLNGFELASAIREHDPALAERVIFMTGDTLSPATRTQLEQSGNLFLPKPFAIEQLEAVVRSLVKRRSIGSSDH
jgi:two-component system NtrC family sensor kinase